MKQLSNRLFLFLPMTLALILLLASPAYAHGGLPENLHDFYLIINLTKHAIEFDRVFVFNPIILVSNYLYNQK